ncbi:MAG TPA: hypothetical protein VHT91_18630 [Kofleriaceae bacterium]|jgi:hypothetical protein|nr:hypothetical protein [Kofleriaceae bacterium]
MTASYRWTFYRSGGVDQVALQTADDLIHLHELDPKLWIALSMPTRGVEIDPRTLDLLDTDHDGHIRQAEVLAAVAWIAEHYRDPSRLLSGGDSVALDDLRDGPMRGGAQRLLADLGKPDAARVSLADVADADQRLAEKPFNGDGVVPPESCDDEAVRAVIADIVASHGAIPDRSGKPGIDQPRADAFFAEARALVAWHDGAGADARPVGDATPAAADAVRAVRAKIEDYFARCRLAAFDPRAAAALNPSDAELAALSGRELSAQAAELASLPIARIDAGAALPFTGVNPAWEDRLAALRAAAVAPLLGPRDALIETDWRAMHDRLAAHEAWRAARPAGAVESLGIDRWRAVLAGDAERDIARLIARDLEVKPTLEAVIDVERLCRFQRDLARLLRNYVNFADFYARKGGVFQAGTLYLDGRGCALVFDVADAAKHSAMAAMSGAYLAYCECTRPGETRTIAAAFTAGDVDNLMVGRNGVFVDRKGKDWEATITKLIANPIGLRQAFWSPYKKAVRLIEERVAKRAAEEDTGSITRLAALEGPAARPAGATKPAKLDVGTVAALGVAIGGIGAFATAVLAALFGLGWWMPIGIAGAILAISGPSMLLAFIKLRRRNLGPLLDASGWAINALTRINVPFGAALTDVAALPPGARRAAYDPYAEKRRPWRFYATTAIVLVLAVTWYLGKLDRLLPGPAQSTAVMGSDAPAYVKPAAPAAPAAAASSPPAAPPLPAVVPAAPAPPPGK